jgi:hypothetical protein
MKLGGLNVQIRRLVVDAQHRTQATRLSDAIGQALQAELAEPSNSRPTGGGSEIGAAIAAQIAQRLPDATRRPGAPA